MMRDLQLLDSVAGLPGACRVVESPCVESTHNGDCTGVEVPARDVAHLRVCVCARVCVCVWYACGMRVVCVCVCVCVCV